MSYSLFWGDLHNHNSVGYAQGSLRRAVEIASEHLDFFAFTGHAQWHDMPKMPHNAQMKWVRGFEVMRATWADVQRQIQVANQRDDFTTFLGYEWHSSQFGDYCLYYPGDEGELVYADDITELQAHARSTQAILIPHHPAYRRGVRGIDWRYLEPELSPVAEIYSEHGASEKDRDGNPFIRHSNGGRWTGSTVQSALAQDLRLGVIASTDDHLGYPGAYGEGLMGAWAASNTRLDILEAIKARRTYGVSGDRIKLWLEINDAPMGSELPFCRKRTIEVDVEGWDEIDRIELVKRNRAVRRAFPIDQEPLGATGAWPDRVRVRIQYGWGPWADLGMARVADWDLSVSLSEGEITACVPCFQSGPFDEERRDRVLEKDRQMIHWHSFTSRRQAFAEDPTKAMLFEIAAPADAQLQVRARRQVQDGAAGGCEITSRLRNLADQNRIALTGPFTSESVMVHRAVGPDRFRAHIVWHDEDTKPDRLDWYYIRVFQSNGHQAWSSPIWVERAH